MSREFFIFAVIAKNQPKAKKRLDNPKIAAYNIFTGYFPKSPRAWGPNGSRPESARVINQKEMKK